MSPRTGVSRVAYVVVAAVAVASAAAVIAGFSDARSAPPLLFGIYPGGGVGTVGAKGATKPEDATLRLRSLHGLKPPATPFVVRLYTSYDGRSAAEAMDGLAPDLRQYAAAGFRIELVVTYRPAESQARVAVAGYVRFVRAIVRALADERRVVSLQVTNEANLSAGLDASDGRFPGARDALVQGVIAAKDEAGRHGASQLRIGFSWGHEGGRAADAFWRGLGRAGGRRLTEATDWIGIDIYPGTWGPALRGTDLAAGVRANVIGALRTMRRVHMRQAGFPGAVAIHVAENGYPTGPGRTGAMQATAASAAIHAVHDVRASLHVTDYRWFDLRDADSADARIESQYGLMRDDYSPKPAYSTYRALVARLSIAGAR